MVALESSNANYFSTTLSVGVTALDTSFTLDALGTLTSPAYLVIDPLSDTKREVIYFDGTWSGTTVVTTTTANRGLAGSASGAQAHDPGTIVTSVPLQQHLEDVHDRVNDHVHDGLTADSQVDTNNLLNHNKSIHDGLALDHNVLSNLTTGDPHTQYALSDGTRAFTGETTHVGIANEDGSAALPAYSFTSDPDTGVWLNGVGDVRIAVGGASKVGFTSSGTTLFDTLLATLGSVSTPGISFSSDPDTGLYANGADALLFSTGGARALAINGSAQVVGETGSVSQPTWTYNGDTDTGIYRRSSGVIGFSSDNALVGGFDANGIYANTGGASTASYSFLGDPDTGMYSAGADELRFAAGGLLVLRMNGTEFEAPDVYTNTTASASNVFVTTTGILQRSTSVGAAKVDIADLRASRPGGGPRRTTNVEQAARALRPVRFRSALPGDDPEVTHVGLVAEDVAEVFPELAFYDDEGAPVGVQYDRVGVIALDLVQQALDRLDAAGI